jgi:hypothetical protein
MVSKSRLQVNERGIANVDDQDLHDALEQVGRHVDLDSSDNFGLTTCEAAAERLSRQWWWWWLLLEG